jgi:hypothetical protein
MTGVCPRLVAGAVCKMGGVASRENFEQILKRLSTEDVDPGDHQFWDEMWKTTLAVEVSIPSQLISFDLTLLLFFRISSKLFNQI